MNTTDVKDFIIYHSNLLVKSECDRKDKSQFSNGGGGGMAAPNGIPTGRGPPKP